MVCECVCVRERKRERETVGGGCSVNNLISNRCYCSYTRIYVYTLHTSYIMFDVGSTNSPHPPPPSKTDQTSDQKITTRYIWVLFDVWCHTLFDVIPVPFYKNVPTVCLHHSSVFWRVPKLPTKNTPNKKIYIYIYIINIYTFIHSPKTYCTITISIKVPPVSL